MMSNIASSGPMPWLFMPNRVTPKTLTLIESSRENALQLLNALTDFGFGSLNLSIEDFTQQDAIIQLGYEPVRIDILTPIKGLDFSEVWRQRVQGPYGNQTVNYIDKDSLIKSKKISNRTHDKADIELLQNDE